MKSKHLATLASVFTKPVPSGIPWKAVEAMLEALGGEIEERAGSRVAVTLGGVTAVFHRPHPKKETDKGAVNSVRRFIERAGLAPDEEGDA